MDRRDTMRSLFDGTGRILEIGPSHFPTFPRRMGFDVEILDHATTEELRRKYTAMQMPIDEIEEVDYVSDGRALHEIIPHRERYDLIFSSHAIEHTTDFLGYLKSCELLLKPDGVVGLAVPDKRYTFDILQPISTTGRVLEAHYRGQSRHAPAVVFDFVANFARLDGFESWSDAASGSIQLARDGVAQVKGLLDNAMQPDSPYHDVHGWIFTPASFRLIMRDLAELGLTRLRERKMVEPGVLEFLVVMGMDGGEDTRSRSDLHKAIIREQVVSGLQMLAAEDPRIAVARDALAAANA